MWPRAVNQMEYVLRYVMESSDAQLFRMMIARYAAIGEVHGRAASSSFRYTADLVHSAAPRMALLGFGASNRVADVISIFDFIANKWNIEKPLISAD